MCNSTIYKLAEINKNNKALFAEKNGYFYKEIKSIYLLDIYYYPFL